MLVVFDDLYKFSAVFMGNPLQNCRFSVHIFKFLRVDKPAFFIYLNCHLGFERIICLIG